MAGVGIGIGIGLGMGGHRPNQPSPLCNAIKKKVLVSLVDGGKQYLLAPHIVYKGHKNAEQLDAVVIERDGKAPNKPKLETFTVSDLSGITLTDTPFEAHAGFDPGDPIYLDKTVCVIEVV